MVPGVVRISQGSLVDCTIVRKTLGRAPPSRSYGVQEWVNRSRQGDHIGLFPFSHRCAGVRKEKCPPVQHFPRPALSASRSNRIRAKRPRIAPIRGTKAVTDDVDYRWRGKLTGIYRTRGNLLIDGYQARTEILVGPTAGGALLPGCLPAGGRYIRHIQRPNCLALGRAEAETSAR